MGYLPILDELLSSDSILFLLAGLAIGLLAGAKWKGAKKNGIGAAASFALYAVCEALSNIKANSLAELALLFLGTAALGSFAGFFINLAASKKLSSTANMK